MNTGDAEWESPEQGATGTDNKRRAGLFGAGCLSVTADTEPQARG